MTSSNRAAMFTSNPSTAVVIDEPSVRREQTGTEVRIPQPEGYTGPEVLRNLDLSDKDMRDLILRPW